jgi:hypothetical protein
MKRFIPTPAMVVAIAALVVATTGSAVAAKKFVIDSSSQVKNGALTLKDFKKAERGKLKGPKGPKGATGATGAAGAAGTPGAPGAPATRLWAAIDVVAGVPSVARASGATGVADIGIGTYVIGFNQDVSQCSWQATPGSVDDAAALNDRTATVELENDDTSPDKLRIRIRNGDDGVVESDVHVAVFC